MEARPESRKVWRQGPGLWETLVDGKMGVAMRVTVSSPYVTTGSSGEVGAVSQGTQAPSAQDGPGTGEAGWTMAAV